MRDKEKWFIDLWTKDELRIIRAIDKQVKAGNIYQNREKNVPSQELMQLSEQFSALSNGQCALSMRAISPR